MFLDNLSTAVLRFCDENHLTYEAASERCELSSRYFGDIARGKTAPTILTLEKLCSGFCCTPNDLLISARPAQGDTYREQMPVVEIRYHNGAYGLTSFPVCPRCDTTLEREYQAYCDRCGQCLDWSQFEKATVLLTAKR